MELPPSITGHLHVTEAGCYPDWQAVGAAIEESLPESQHDAAWDATCLAWVRGICRQLGAGYRVLETQNFLIVSGADQPSVERTGQAFEDVRRKILSQLTDLIAGPVKGKEVALIFASDEQYYRYIAHFFPEGEHPMNGGMCLRGGTYLHLAFPSTEASPDLRTLAHENRIRPRRVGRLFSRKGKLVARTGHVGDPRRLGLPRIHPQLTSTGAATSSLNSVSLSPAR